MTESKKALFRGNRSNSRFMIGFSGKGHFCVTYAVRMGKSGRFGRDALLRVRRRHPLVGSRDPRDRRRHPIAAHGVYLGAFRRCRRNAYAAARVAPPYHPPRRTTSPWFTTRHTITSPFGRGELTRRRGPKPPYHRCSLLSPLCFLSPLPSSLSPLRSELSSIGSEQSSMSRLESSIGRLEAAIGLLLSANYICN